MRSRGFFMIIFLASIFGSSAAIIKRVDNVIQSATKATRPVWRELTMANQQYLFWVMAGALTLLFLVVSVFVGMSRTAKHGYITFGIMFAILVVGAFIISR